MQKKFLYITIAILFASFSALFTYNGFVTLDPDFGWRLTIGKYILARWIPSIDPFSYTMPTYHFIDHEWLTHIILYLIYSHFGYSVLATLFGIIGAITLALLIKKIPLVFKPIVLLIVGSSFLYFFSIKPQVLTWTFFTILLLVLFTKRFMKLLPVLFLFWANMHGGFAIGLLVFFVYVVMNYKHKYFFIFIASIAVTVINPYGLWLWKEILISAVDPQLRLVIGEWRPTFIEFNIAFCTAFVVYGAFIVRYWKKYSLWERTTFIILLLLGLSSLRNVPIWIIFGTALAAKAFRWTLEDIKPQPIFTKIYCVFFLVLFSLAFFQIFSTYKFTNTSAEEVHYPKKALEYLKKNLTNGNIFNAYNWGGYLIWKFPEKKVFIDGRMPSWRQNNYSAINEYFDILKAKESLSVAVNNYSIDTILLPTDWFTSPEQQKYIADFKKELEKNHFNIVYKDTTAIIFSKRH